MLNKHPDQIPNFIQFIGKQTDLMPGMFRRAAPMVGAQVHHNADGTIRAEEAYTEEHTMPLNTVTVPLINSLLDPSIDTGELAKKMKSRYFQILLGEVSDVKLTGKNRPRHN